MFTNDDLIVESIESYDPKDLIPYHLTGARVLHKQGYFGSSVKVAVVDTGCDFNHDALRERIKERNHNFCGYNDSSMDDHSHGSHVASTIAELAPKAEIVPIKVLSPMDGKNSWLISGLEYLVSRDDIDVVNMSLSGTLKVGSDDYNRIHNAIKSLVDKNVFVVVASGNTGKESVRYPAYFEEVTTVGAVDVYKHEALFSTESPHVDMCQVGVNLIGAKLGGGYCKMSGTSMATPMVAGIAALLIDKYKSQHDGKRPDGRLIHHMLKLSAIDIGVKGLDKKTGAGFISLDPSAAIIQMTIDEKVYSINGEEHVMDVAPFIKENRSFVPVRYASHEKFVDWDGTTRTITIV